MSSSEAYAIPDELVLSRSFTLPSIAEADLDAALHLEVAACSPFSHDDTASGWRITRGEDRRMLTVELVIASRTAVMGFLGEHFNLVDPSVPEVWANTGSHWVRLRGFGEMAAGSRLSAPGYSRRGSLSPRVLADFTVGGYLRDHCRPGA